MKKPAFRVAVVILLVLMLVPAVSMTQLSMKPLYGATSSIGKLVINGHFPVFAQQGILIVYTSLISSNFATCFPGSNLFSFFCVFNWSPDSKIAAMLLQVCSSFHLHSTCSYFSLIPSDYTDVIVLLHHLFL